MTPLDSLMVEIATCETRMEAKKAEKESSEALSSQKNMAIVKEFVSNWKEENNVPSFSNPPEVAASSGAETTSKVLRIGTGGAETARLLQENKKSHRYQPYPDTRHHTQKLGKSSCTMEETFQFDVQTLISSANNRIVAQSGNSTMEVVDEGTIDVVSTDSPEVQIISEYIPLKDTPITGNNEDEEPQPKAANSEWSYELLGNTFTMLGNQTRKIQALEKNLKEMTASRDEAMVRFSGAEFAHSTAIRQIEYLENEKTRLQETVNGLQKSKMDLNEEVSQRMKIFVESYHQTHMQMTHNFYTAQMNMAMRPVPDTPSSSNQSSPGNQILHTQFGNFMQVDPLFIPQNAVPGQPVCQLVRQPPVAQPQQPVQQKRSPRRRRTNPAGNTQGPPQPTQIGFEQSEAATAENTESSAQAENPTRVEKTSPRKTRRVQDSQ